MNILSKGVLLSFWPWSCQNTLRHGADGAVDQHSYAYVCELMRWSCWRFLMFLASRDLSLETLACSSFGEPFGPTVRDPTSRLTINQNTLWSFFPSCTRCGSLSNSHATFIVQSFTPHVFAVDSTHCQQRSVPFVALRFCHHGYRREQRLLSTISLHFHTTERTSPTPSTARVITTIWQTHLDSDKPLGAAAGATKPLRFCSGPSLLLVYLSPTTTG